MAYNSTTGNWDLDLKMVQLKAEKTAANELQKRKHEDWTDNYDLYRGKNKTNRLTQRQAVNIPLMKETVKTMLAGLDETPMIDWKELGGDEDKQIVYQEVWDTNYKDYNFEIFDLLDKKNILLYGIGTTLFNLEDAGVSMTALDPYDVVYDPLIDVSDIESARFIVLQNQFRSIREILADERYTAEGKQNLMTWSISPPGVINTAENQKIYDEKIQRMKDMGVNSSDFNLFAGGDRIINLTYHFTQVWEKNGWVRHAITYAEDCIELMDKTIKELLGVDFWPFELWTEDPETQDVYADAVADLVRTPNKIINVWYSQLIENRTLKNFQMHWFMPGQNYQPQTYQPGPGVMLPAPPGDDINKVIKPVEIQGLDDTLAAIAAITQIVERGTGATAIDKGEPQPGVTTLGEVQILVGKAMERRSGIAKLNRLAWYRRAKKWDRLMHANAPKLLKLYKTSQAGKVYPKIVYAGDWVSKAGYEPISRSSSEQEQETIKELQKFDYVLKQFPNNVALRKIAQKRELESLNLTPEELKQVEEAEVQAANMAATAAAPQQPTQQPAPNPLAADVQQMSQQLDTMQHA